MGCPAGGISGAEGDVRMKKLVRFDSTITEDTPGRSSTHQVDVLTPSVDLKNLRSHFWMQLSISVPC
eukprot:559085-Pelagomonas_calceolata.AAC.1